MTPKLIELRRKLAERLGRQIRNPAVEAKELHAFDLMISRRLFLKGAGLGVLATLVNSALPPTAWGKASDACRAIKPNDVGLTPGEMATVTQASGIDFGTELFSDTIYSQPAVAFNQQDMHGLIEAARSRMRVQSQLADQTPLEENFFDTGFHFGPSELIQLEKGQNGNWQLVHYFHPWQVRTDGGRADGLIRHVIMNHNDGLINPTRIFCITGSHTNEFTDTSQGSQVAASYLVYVEQNDGNAAEHFVVIGHALSSVESGAVTSTSDYPLTWNITSTNDIDNLPGDSVTDYLFADKYVNPGLDLAVPGVYTPVRATEHIIIYLADRLKIIALDDITTPGSPILVVTSIPFPDDVTDVPRVAHVEFNPVPGSTGKFLQVSDFALVAPYSNGINLYTNQHRNSHINTNAYKNLAGGGKWLDVTYSSSDYAIGGRNNNALISDDRPDYFSLKGVHGLASTVVNLSGVPYSETINLKIGNFPGTDSTNNLGLCLFALSRRQGDENGNDPEQVSYFLGGDFPLAVPDAAGIGKIIGISGGISKFGGLRLFASDDIGNLFMLRQQRLADSTTPYSPPIYIQNDAQGNPASFSTSKQMQLPSTTAAGSNLQGFHAWMKNFYGNVGINQEPDQVVAYNFLLSGLLGFGTDDTSVAQATWLGSGVEAVYAPKRCGHDAEHMVVREISDDGTNSQFNVFNVFNNIVEKTWVSRKIAGQVMPDAPGLQESGDFYQAMIYATNLYGDLVALNDTSNPGMQIEVRGDAPATVLDLVNNKYYDVDRYTSFVALPDPTSNQLRLAVKAENFAQILYVRLLQTDEVSASPSDSAMLNADTSAVGTATDWVAINIAADGQARMAASSSPTATTPSSTCSTGTCADQVYICTQSLCKSSTSGNNGSGWQTKGGYQPDDHNLDSLSSYLNQSGQNLADASTTVTAFVLGATQSDPLTSTTPLTADANRATLSTTFNYQGGTIDTVSGTTSALPGALPGSAFSSLGHALHDALHWLQHVEGKLYSSLANGVTVVIDDTENISVTVDKTIMKQVNGIDEDLNEVVSTVEEYASVVVNVVVTIVESSFIYQFIELLIALISLFIYIEDIRSLSASLKDFMRNLPDPSSQYPLAPVDVNYPWEEKLTGYVGNPNNVESDTSQANTDAVVDEVVDGLLNAVMKNPFTKKLMDEVMSALSRAISASDSSPVQFNLDSTIVADQIQLAEDFAADIDALFVNVTDDVVNLMVNEVVDDIENPQQTLPNLTSGIGQFMTEVDADVMDAAYTALGQLTATETMLINDILNQSDFQELRIPLLADLFKLFGIGDTSGSKVILGSGDAICFPLALIIWVAIFMATGKSTNNISKLIPPPPGLPGATKDDELTFTNATVAAVLMTVNGVVWSYMQTEPPSQRTTGSLRSLNLLGELANLSRWLMATTTTAIEWDTQQVSVNWTKGYLPVFTFCKTAAAVTAFAAKITSNTTPLMALTTLNTLLNEVAIVWSIVDGAANDSSGNETLGEENWAIVVGNDVGRGGVFFKLAYALMFGTDETYAEGEDSLELFSACVVGLPLAGFGAAAEATGFKEFLPTSPAPVTGCLQLSPHAINQLLDQLDALNVRLPKKAACKQETRLVGYLKQAGQAYARGDGQEGDARLTRFARTLQSMKQGRRLPAEDADFLIQQVRDLLTCQG